MTDTAAAFASAGPLGATAARGVAAPAPGAAIDAVTGAAGFTGRHIARLLLERGRRVRNLTGHPDRPDPFGGRVPCLPLRFDDASALQRALRGVDTLYNTYWVRFARGGVDHDVAVRNSLALLRAARAAGVRRVVHVSITGADPGSPLPYFRGKGLVERALRRTGLPHAIVRPTLMFGEGDVLINNIAWILRRFPVFTLPGDGRYPVQPVHVADVARIAVEAGASGIPADEREAAGPDTYAFRDLVARIAAAVGRRVRLLPAAPGMVAALGDLLGLVVGDVVVTRDELRGLARGLLVARGPATGTVRLQPWLEAHASRLGVRYASELARHFR